MWTFVGAHERIINPPVASSNSVSFFFLPQTETSPNYSCYCRDINVFNPRSGTRVFTRLLSDSHAALSLCARVCHHSDRAGDAKVQGIGQDV